MNKQLVRKVSIYPPIGIARIGNSPEFFLASETPGKSPSPEGGFKDGNNLFKKQVPLFRIYATDENDIPLYEITAESAIIEWRVHVANRKAAWYQFNNALDLGKESIPSTKRNSTIKDSEREQLVIDPGLRTISGMNKSGENYHFKTGAFFNKEVLLGEIRTDDKGRLMFFGGNGISESNSGIGAITFANNDGWYDDISDGTVRASVIINGKKLEAEPAVVICAPPNFAPGLFSVVTMYDVVYDLYIRNGWLKGKKQISFYEDIHPILSRMSSTQWVNEGFFMLFGTNSPSDFSSEENIKVLSNPAPEYKDERMRLLEWFRYIKSSQYEPDKLPPHYGDLFGDYEKLPQVDLAVTDTQYEMLKQWADGNFITGTPIEEILFDKMTLAQQMEALLKAPLEECLGGPFHPGIEVTWPFRQLIMWEKPFRLKLLPEGELVQDDYGPILTSDIALAANGPLDGSGPGSLTRWLGVPWQTDEASCLSGYDQTLYLPLPSFWAVRVPNTVLSMDSFMRITTETLNTGQRFKHFSYRVDWLRDFSTNYVPRINRMVANWHKLGVITKHITSLHSPFFPKEFWVETDRSAPVGEDPTLKQVKLAEKDINVKRQEITPKAILFTAAVPDEGIPRESKPLKRHQL